MKVAIVLAVLVLTGCTQAPIAKTSPSPSPLAVLTPTATPTPVVSLSVAYLDQVGSRYTVWVDVTNRGAAAAVGHPLVSLYWKQLSIGTVCGPAVSVAPGATTQVRFERLNGPAALFDHEDLTLVPAC